MNSRLQQFLTLENLTPSALADLIGVQRSGLSHILSGRNKPGYDFIKKILIKFPNLNAEWLILGIGKPYKENKNIGTDIQFQEKQYDNLQFDNQPILTHDFNDSPIIPSILNDTILNQKTDNQNNTQENSVLKTPENSINETLSSTTLKKRRAKRVIIFYEDGSFEELFPHSI